MPGFGSIDRFLDDATGINTEGKVQDINKNKWRKLSEVICVKCHHRWIVDRPTEALLKMLECEHCGPGYVIETGENVNK